MFDILLADQFERSYGIKDIGFGNMYELFNPMKTGIFDLYEQ